MTQCTSTINDVGVDNGGDHEGFSVREGTPLAQQDVEPQSIAVHRRPYTARKLRQTSRMTTRGFLSFQYL